MEANYLVIGVVVAIGLLIVVIAIIRNQKDKTNLEQRLNNDYTKDEEFDSDLNDKVT